MCLAAKQHADISPATDHLTPTQHEIAEEIIHRLDCVYGLNQWCSTFLAGRPDGHYLGHSPGHPRAGSSLGSLYGMKLLWQGLIQPCGGRSSNLAGGGGWRGSWPSPVGKGSMAQSLEGEGGLTHSHRWGKEGLTWPHRGWERESSLASFSC